MTTGGPERQQPPARQGRVAEHRQRELRVLVAEPAQAFGRAAARRADGSKCHATAGVAKSPVREAPRGLASLQLHDDDRLARRGESDR